jgi:hypothetical protein
MAMLTRYRVDQDFVLTAALDLQTISDYPSFRCA